MNDEPQKAQKSQKDDMITVRSRKKMLLERYLARLKIFQIEYTHHL